MVPFFSTNWADTKSVQSAVKFKGFVTKQTRADWSQVLLPSPVDIWQPLVNITVIFKTQRTTVNLKHKNTLSLLKEMLSASPIFVHLLSMFWLILARLQIHKTLSPADSRYKVIVILGYNLNIELNPSYLQPLTEAFKEPSEHVM